MIKEYKHENGYSAVLYGKSSMVVYYNEEKRIHTGSRGVNTEEEVMALLKGMPEFMKMISEFLGDEEVTE